MIRYLHHSFGKFSSLGDILPCPVSQIGLQTAMGQMLDLITTHTGAKDLARYRIQGYLTSSTNLFKPSGCFQFHIVCLPPLLCFYQVPSHSEV